MPVSASRQQKSTDSQGSARLTFKVRGLDCAEEVSVLKRAVGPLVGGEERLAFDVLNGRMMVLEGAGAVAPAEIRKAVADAGMSAEEWQRGREEADAPDRRKRLQSWFTVASGAFLVAGIAVHGWRAGSFGEALRLFATHDPGGMPWPEIALYALAVAFGVRYVVPRAWTSARRLRPDMHLLMTIAVAGAIGIGEWFEAATVAFLFALSLALESWSVARARRAISALLDLAPAHARVKHADGSEVETPAGDVPVGSRFVVKPGERLPLDGRVIAGASSVNQAPITGESMPVPKGPGDPVFAGSINESGSFEYRVTATANQSTVARIIKAVEDAQGGRAPSQRFVDRFARIYTPAVFAVAVLVALVPPLALGFPWMDWIYKSLVLLVIACPCALVISTPVTLVAGLMGAARRGLLVKGGEFLERAAYPVGKQSIGIATAGTALKEEAPLGSYRLNLTSLARSIADLMPPDGASVVLASVDDAIEKVVSSIQLARAGLRAPEKPIGSFLFSGPTGVGKTEVARQLAYCMGIELIRFDMSEYMERHAVSRLIGAPPGYVGFEQGGLLTEAISKKPYAVLLLDEIEKAHPDIFNILLQVFEDGHLTDGLGNRVNFKNAILIMTSNIGARFIQKKASMGFQSELGDQQKGVQEMVLGEVRRTFNPEFINRVDELIVFEALTDDDLRKILALLVDQLNANLLDRKMKVLLSSEVTDWIIDVTCKDRSYGARPLRRAIQRYVEDPLAEELIRGHLQGGEIEVYLETGQLTYRPAGAPVAAGRRLAANV